MKSCVVMWTNVNPNPICMSLDCERQLEYPEKGLTVDTGRTCKLHTGRASVQQVMELEGEHTKQELCDEEEHREKVKATDHM